MGVVPLQLAVPVMTSDNRPVRRLTVSAPDLLMTLSPRDRHVAEFFATYHHATTPQIGAVFFADRSLIPLQRCLKRLERLEVIRRVGRRQLAGNLGSGALTYELDRAGHYGLGVEREFKRADKPNDHDLLRSDARVALCLAERLGALRLAEEPEVERKVGHSQADMLLRFTVPAVEGTRLVAVEAEVYRKSPGRLADKCEGYQRTLDEMDGGTMPLVLFLVAQEWQAQELKAKLWPKHPKPGWKPINRELFKVTHLQRFTADLITLV